VTLPAISPALQPPMDAARYAGMLDDDLGTPTGTIPEEGF
jgi:hypothetical protein